MRSAGWIYASATGTPPAASDRVARADRPAVLDERDRGSGVVRDGFVERPNSPPRPGGHRAPPRRGRSARRRCARPVRLAGGEVGMVQAPDDTVSTLVNDQQVDDATASTPATGVAGARISWCWCSSGSRSEAPGGDACGQLRQRRSHPHRRRPGGPRRRSRSRLILSLKPAEPSAPPSQARHDPAARQQQPGARPARQRQQGLLHRQASYVSDHVASPTLSSRKALTPREICSFHSSDGPESSYASCQFCHSYVGVCG